MAYLFEGTVKVTCMGEKEIKFEIVPTSEYILKFKRDGTEHKYYVAIDMEKATAGTAAAVTAVINVPEETLTFSRNYTASCSGLLCSLAVSNRAISFEVGVDCVLKLPSS